MRTSDIGRYRLHNQHVSQQAFSEPEEVVAWLGAVQAQDYPAAKWAIGLRVPEATETTIEQAIAQRSIIRTWALRGTLHLVAASDIRWMLALVAPGILARTTSRYRELELDEPVLAKARDVITTTLEGGKQCTRQEVFTALEQCGIATAGLRGTFILYRLALDMVTCHGSLRGKQQTFTLLDEWKPDTRTMERDEALAELALRYFSSHGPATVQDFLWWSGLPAAEARAGFAMAQAQLRARTIGEQTYWMHRDMPERTHHVPEALLLPAFDEYMVGYTDRSAALKPADSRRVYSGNGIFYPIIVLDGQVAGTWKRTFNKKNVRVELQPFTPLTEEQHRTIAVAAQNYSRFTGLALAEPIATTSILPFE